MRLAQLSVEMELEVIICRYSGPSARESEQSQLVTPYHKFTSSVYRAIILRKKLVVMYISKYIHIKQVERVAMDVRVG